MAEDLLLTLTEAATRARISARHLDRLFAASTNAATMYVDPTGAVGTTRSNAAIPLAAGSSVCWPAITSAVSVYGPAGASYTGSAG